MVIDSRDDYGRITFRNWISAGGGEAGYIAPDPLHPGVAYAGDTYGTVHRFDRSTGQSQDVSPAPAASFYTPFSERRFRFTWTSPIVFDPLDPHTLYLGAQMVLRTPGWRAPLGGGESGPHRRGGGWRRPGRHGTGTPVRGQRLGARARGRVRDRPLAGARGPGVGRDGRRPHPAHHRRRRPLAGRHAARPHPLEQGERPRGVALRLGHRLRGDRPPPAGRPVALHLPHPRHGGAHWTRIDSGIPEGAFVRAVRADPVRRGLLYAATERGVYVSFDDGARWQSLQLDLPTVAVRDLAVAHGDLVAATHGRSILDPGRPHPRCGSWARRRWEPRPTCTARARAWRLRRSENNDTPLPGRVSPGGESAGRRHHRLLAPGRGLRAGPHPDPGRGGRHGASLLERRGALHAPRAHLLHLELAAALGDPRGRRRSPPVRVGPALGAAASRDARLQHCGHRRQGNGDGAAGPGGRPGHISGPAHRRQPHRRGPARGRPRSARPRLRGRAPRSALPGARGPGRPHRADRDRPRRRASGRPSRRHSRPAGICPPDWPTPPVACAGR